jgi:putative phosphoesterase
MVRDSKMKFGLISDIHGNSSAFKAVLDCLIERVDHILFLGDFAGYYSFVNECIEMIPADMMTGVRGNHDQILLDFLSSELLPDDYQKAFGSALKRSAEQLSETSKERLFDLPVQLHLNIEGVSLALMHGAPWDPLNGRVYPDFSDWNRFESCNDDIILLGHTHYPMVKHTGRKLIINPGSVGQPRDGKKGACFAELDISSRDVQFFRVSYDPRQVIEDARIRDPENPYLVQVLQ